MPEKVRLNFDAPEGLDNQITAYADAYTLSKAEAIRRLIDLGLHTRREDEYDYAPHDDVADGVTEDTRPPEEYQGDERHGLYETLCDPEMVLYALLDDESAARFTRNELLTDYVDQTGVRVTQEIAHKHGTMPRLSDRQIGYISLLVDFMRRDTDVLLDTERKTLAEIVNDDE